MTKNNLYKVSEIQITYRNKVKADKRPKVHSALDAYHLFLENWDDLTINLFEEFKILLLDRSNKCIGIALISKGGISGTVVDPKLVFVSALKARASGIILGHNHPSQNLKPSHQDKQLTEKLIKGGQLLDIQVLDHIIITDDSFLSFANDGLMTPTLK